KKEDPRISGVRGTVRRTSGQNEFFWPETGHHSDQGSGQDVLRPNDRSPSSILKRHNGGRGVGIGAVPNHSFQHYLFPVADLDLPSSNGDGGTAGKEAG
ncbi:hypothetical protein IJG71_03370, partial [Candidatus Saccharibacteria bacterium]|nr:hypothetical protein [Candidatus Saccharibacteria bacterium]